MGYGECHGEFTYSWIVKDLQIIAWGIHLNMGNIMENSLIVTSTSSIKTKMQIESAIMATLAISGP